MVATNGNDKRQRTPTPSALLPMNTDQQMTRPTNEKHMHMHWIYNLQGTTDDSQRWSSCSGRGWRGYVDETDNDSSTRRRSQVATSC